VLREDFHCMTRTAVWGIGDLVGDLEGNLVGEKVGFQEGLLDGLRVGEIVVGAQDGLWVVGDSVVGDKEDGENVSPREVGVRVGACEGTVGEADVGDSVVGFCVTRSGRRILIPGTPTTRPGRMNGCCNTRGSLCIVAATTVDNTFLRVIGRFSVILALTRLASHWLLTVVTEFKTTSEYVCNSLLFPRG